MADSTAFLDALAGRLADEGKLVEAGFTALRAIDDRFHGLTKDQLELVHLAYVAGAQHIFASVFGFLEPGDEPTANDMKRLTLLSRELDRWAQKMQLKIVKPMGRA